MSQELVPQILDFNVIRDQFLLDEQEKRLLETGGKLFQAGFYPQALLELWTASSNNIRRRIEAYGVDIFLSVVKDESGRKTYNKDGDTINKRWENVDDFVVIQGAKKLSLINEKAAKVLETINWMRNNASSAHASDEQVGEVEVNSFASLLHTLLFLQPLPDPGHSVQVLFKPVKENALSQENIQMFQDQIKSYKISELRMAYGFLLDVLCEGVEPGISNSKPLLITCWEVINDDIKRIAGHMYHKFDVDSSNDISSDNGAKTRILEYLLKVKGILFIPEGSRAKIYRKLADNLRVAKNTSYGWGREESVAKTISQFGLHIPNITFEEFYQEVLSVICGNYWGRSEAYKYLEGFVLDLNTDKLRKILEMFRENSRVQEELSTNRPKEFAIELIKRIKEKFTIEANKDEADRTIELIKNL